MSAMLAQLRKYGSVLKGLVHGTAIQFTDHKDQPGVGLISTTLFGRPIIVHHNGETQELPAAFSIVREVFGTTAGRYDEGIIVRASLSAMEGGKDWTESRMPTGEEVMDNIVSFDEKFTDYLIQQHGIEAVGETGLMRAQEDWADAHPGTPFPSNDSWRLRPGLVTPVTGYRESDSDDVASRRVFTRSTRFLSVVHVDAIAIPGGQFVKDHSLVGHSIPHVQGGLLYFDPKELPPFMQDVVELAVQDEIKKKTEK